MKVKNINKALLLLALGVQTSCMESNVTDGHEWVDLGLPSGTLWATCNVDANKSEDYGGYFSWDEGNKSVANWGDCWCMPSKEQWEELIIGQTLRLI